MSTFRQTHIKIGRDGMAFLFFWGGMKNGWKNEKKAKSGSVVVCLLCSIF